MITQGAASLAGGEHLILICRAFSILIAQGMCHKIMISSCIQLFSKSADKAQSLPCIKKVILLTNFCSPSGAPLGSASCLRLHSLCLLSLLSLYLIQSLLPLLNRCPFRKITQGLFVPFSLFCFQRRPACLPSTPPVQSPLRSLCRLIPCLLPTSFSSTRACHFCNTW